MKEKAKQLRLAARRNAYRIDMQSTNLSDAWKRGCKEPGSLKR